MNEEQKRDARGRFKKGFNPLPDTCRHGVHGLRAMKDTLSLIKREGKNWIEELGEVGHVVEEWKRSIIDDLGGEGEVSAMQRTIIETAARSWVILQSIDAYLLKRAATGHQPGSGKALINRRKSEVFPFVMERQQLANSLVKNLQALGLERRVKSATPSLDEYVSSAYGGEKKK